ncbi:hypothetical protein [Fructobacillus papyrifericola]|uniref:Uncharacterized protein n=1 Tax=Fructobacillus papyrifericola TaxID=2713172 RepID=A0ABS5QSB0_9LACO|nr:hypothetical protein [Fructobacillus papyrifericola]MBS9336094.1 hypothetical protein [Fructobacillus papyrifericola]
MNKREILREYFTGCNGWTLENIEQLKRAGFNNRFAEENCNLWEEIHWTLDPYVATLPPEIVQMQHDHYKHRKPFGEYYNIVAPTAVIQEVNNDLNRLAKSIKLSKRAKGSKLIMMKQY